MLAIDFNDQTGKVKSETEQFIEQLLNVAAEMEDVPEGAEVSITFLTDAEIQSINSEYRGKNTPTDVISFAMEELGEGETVIISEEDMPYVLGDILISIETAERQAADYGHGFDREIGFLSVHGFLHLLGYDHMTEEDEKKMFTRQNEILTRFGLER